jgi:hypothetical protein
MSSVTVDPVKALFLGLRMIKLMTVARLKRPRLIVSRVPPREVEDGFR